MITEAIISMVLIWLIWNVCATYMEKRRMPPGPFPLPFIGNALQMMKDPLDPFGKLIEKYGDIFTFYRPDGPVVVLNTASLIRQARIGTRDDLSGRNHEQLYPFNEMFGNNDIAMSDFSPAYLFRRRVFKSAMHVFGAGIENVEDRTRYAVKLAIEEIEKKEGQPFWPKELLDASILVQLWEWLSSKNESLNGPTVKNIREMLDLATDVAFQSPLYHMLPFLKYFPTQFRRNVQRARKLTRAVFIPEFQKHMETYNPGVVRDLTDSFIKAYEKELAKETGKNIGSIKDIADLMLDVATGASDTTSTSITWLILYLVLHEDVQRKIHDEIDTVIGHDRLPKIKDAQNMPYLQSTLCEVQRISGLIPFTGSNATRDIKIDGYDIPKGTFVMLNLKQAHHDEREWPEPNEFKPERFIDDDGKFVGWTKVNGFIPFGLGRRECAGSSLAKIMMFIVTSTLLQRYEFALPKDSEIPSTKSPFISAVVRPQEFKVIAKQRD